MAIDSEARTSRRGLLAAALGGLGGLVVAKLGRPDPAAAADGGNAILGQPNESTTETSFQNTVSGETSLVALHDDGIGMSSGSTTGTGIRGDSLSGAPSDFTLLSYRSGVIGTAGGTGDGSGNYPSIAHNTDEVGVYGFSNVSVGSVGAWGDSWDGIGLQGTGDWGVAGYGGAVGVYAAAASPTGYALFTQGKIRFNGRAGRTYITSGHIYKDVAISGMTTGSYVIASLVSHRTGFTVESVVSYAGKFRLYLNKTATSTTYFSYLVIG